MPTTNLKLRVFLCHSSTDKPIVRELYQRLNAEGWIDPWLDEENLLPGQDWDNASNVYPSFLSTAPIAFLGVITIVLMVMDLWFKN